MLEEKIMTDHKFLEFKSLPGQDSKLLEILSNLVKDNENYMALYTGKHVYGNIPESLLVVEVKSDLDLNNEAKNIEKIVGKYCDALYFNRGATPVEYNQIV